MEVEQAASQKAAALANWREKGRAPEGRAFQFNLFLCIFYSVSCIFCTRAHAS